jgi:hypothetical protein
MYGFDISTLHEVSHFKCFIENGWTFIIPRCYRGIAIMDENCRQNMINARDAGMSRIDAYFFPCFTCGNVAGQVSTYWNTVSAWDVEITRHWVDIEGGWSSDHATNQAFFNELMKD